MVVFLLFVLCIKDEITVNNWELCGVGFQKWTISGTRIEKKNTLRGNPEAADVFEADRSGDVHGHAVQTTQNQVAGGVEKNINITKTLSFDALTKKIVFLKKSSYEKSRKFRNKICCKWLLIFFIKIFKLTSTGRHDTVGEKGKIVDFHFNILGIFSLDLVVKQKACGRNISNIIQSTAIWLNSVEAALPFWSHLNLSVSSKT